ncbi:MAG: Ig-like domain-containing protein [Candidatus Promineifilaceae bacterium]
MKRLRRISPLLLALLLAAALISCRQREKEATQEAQPEGSPTAAAVDTPAGEQPAGGPFEGQQPTLAADWPPQLVAFSPEPGETASLNGAITLRFDQPMNQASVEQAFMVSELGEAAAVRGDFSWPRADTLVFTPAGNLERERHYQVRLRASAAGRNGQSLAEPLTFAVQTVGFLEVSQVIPEPGSQEVQTDAAITVLFDRPVVPLVATLEQAGLPQPLVFEPELNGAGRWVSSSVFRFVPAQPLAGATQYAVTIPAGLEDVAGGVLADEFSWSFRTLRPSVVSMEPANRADHIRPGRPLTITFNMPMDRPATEAAISLEPAAPFTFDWSEAGRQLTLAPDGILALETEYTLTVAESARSASGLATLDRQTSSTFSTVRLPAVVSTDPAGGAHAESYQAGASIRFASPMDLATFEGQVQIQPAPEQVRYFFDDRSFNLSLSFELQRNTEYVISVPATAGDPYGNTLGEPYSFSFTTAPFEPLVALNLPYGISQLSDDRPTVVQVIHRNVSSIRARLYDAGLPIARLASPNLAQESAFGQEIRAWDLPAGAPTDQVAQIDLALADGGTLPTGVYLLWATAPESDADHLWWQKQKNLIVVADTNLVVKEHFGFVYVWATNLASGLPAAGLDLTLYDADGHQLATALSDGDGLATIPYDFAGDYLPGVVVVSNQPGQAGFGVGSSVWIQNLDPWQFGLNSSWEDEPAQFAFLYTDRPIYRPGDSVHFRGIVRDADYGRYPLPSLEQVRLKLIFLNAYEEIAFDFGAELDENGEFSGDYVIPADAQLGTYQLTFKSANIRATREFTVAEYRKPEFQVLASAAEAAVLRGEASQVSIEAGYLFGGPATDLAVTWTAYVRDYQFMHEGRPYTFGDSDDFVWWSRGPFDFSAAGVYGSYLTSGSGLTDRRGRLEIELPAELLAEVEAGSRVVTVEATVVDVTNNPVSARAEVVYHAAETYVGIAAEDYLLPAGQAAAFDLLTVDWEDEAAPNSDVEVIFYRREWEPVREEQFWQYATLWEPNDTEVGRASTTTDGLGQAAAEFTPERGGTYRIVATVTDGAGRSQSSSTSIWVTDPNFSDWRSDPFEKSMGLISDRVEYAPGDTAHILVQSPFRGPVKAWLTIERGLVIEQRVIDLEGANATLEVPITLEHAPNVFVTVTAVKGVDESSPFADIRIGMVELPVSPAAFGLNVSLQPQAQQFRPGETASYDVQVTDANGNPVQANFSLALADLAVLTLLPDNAPQILEAFYARQPTRSRLGTGLNQSGENRPVEIPLEAGGLGGGDEGGGAGGAAAEVFDLGEDEVRRDFPDTAFWRAQIATDSDGRAVIEIPLPDSLTTWRLSSKAVSDYAASGETLVGQASVDVIATLPLLIRPVTPRFMTVGDRIELAAAIHNNTAGSLEVSVRLEATGVSLLGPAEQSLTVAAGGREVVHWPVVVEDVAFADLTFRAEAGEHSDATKPTFGLPPEQYIPVTRFTGEDVVGASGVLEGPGRRVEAILLPENVDQRQGEVQVSLSPSLAAALLDALSFVNRPAFLEEPECPSAVAGRLLANAATLLALQELDLDRPALIGQINGLAPADIGRLEAAQLGSRGWSWCFSRDASPFLSAYILLALARAQEAGFAVSPAVLGDGAGYVRGRLRAAASLNEAWAVNRQAFFLYVLAEVEPGEAGRLDDLFSEHRLDEVEPGEAGRLDDLFSEHRALLDPYAKGLLIQAYERSGGGGANQRALLNDLNDSVVLSAAGAHWEDAERDWDNLASDIRGTAMIIAALAAVEPDHALLPNAVRWLMVARKAGHWPSQHESAWGILALSDWMAASGELGADYDYSLTVNGRPAAEGHFDAANIDASEEMALPLADLERAEVNFLEFGRRAGPGRLYYTAYLDSFILAQELPAVDRGFSVQRRYFDAACDPELESCEPITAIQAGRPVRVELTIAVPEDRTFVRVEDPIPAGAEAVDPGLQTSASGQGGQIEAQETEFRYGYWGWWYFENIEYRDSRVVFTSEFLPAGTYLYSYTLNTLLPGAYQVNPTTARETFFPDVFGRSEGLLFEISPAGSS